MPGAVHGRLIWGVGGQWGNQLMGTGDSNNGTMVGAGGQSRLVATPTPGGFPPIPSDPGAHPLPLPQLTSATSTVLSKHRRGTCQLGELATCQSLLLLFSSGLSPQAAVGAGQTGSSSIPAPQDGTESQK